LEQALTMVAIFAGFALVVISLILPRLARERGGNIETLTPRGADEDLRALERIEDGALKLEEVSRDLFGRLDTRARMLIRLIEEAEVRANELQAVIERTKEEA
jgi:hypothetical protein